MIAPPLSLRFSVLLLAAALLLPASVRSEETAADSQIKQWVNEHVDEIVALYEEFHRTPEISFQEQETAARLAAQLKELGAEVSTGIGGHGVVGLLRNGDGPTVMVRTDLDALPVTENTGLPYASTATTKNENGVEVGVMHACGHDLHIANLVGVARYLASHKDQWSGTVLLLGQPAEERGAGAAAMLADGLFTRFPRPDFAIALHVDANLPTGFVGYRAGYAMANVDSVDITMRGRGGHGSFPQGCIDPIVMAASLVLDLQTIVSREVSPLEPAVVTVGTIHGGTKHNIIPDTCQLQLTVRSYSEEVRKKIREAIHRKANAIAQSHRAPEPDVKYSEGTPSLFNDERLAERMSLVFARVLGEEKVTLADRTMGGEDFSRYGLAGVPVFMFRLGSVDSARLDEFAGKGTTPPSLHSSEYYPDAADALRTGLTAMTAAVLEIVGKR